MQSANITRSRRNWLLACATGAAAAVAPWFDLRGRAATRSPEVDEHLPDVPLLTHEGKAVRFYSDLVRGRIVFINMMYAQCTNRCPPMTQNLKRVHAMLGDRVGRDVFMYSLTLRPEFMGFVLPSKIYGCIASRRPILFVGPQGSDVHWLCKA